MVEYVPATQGVVSADIDPLMVERLSRAKGLLESLANCPDDANVTGVREIATEAATLIGDPMQAGGDNGPERTTGSATS